MLLSVALLSVVTLFIFVATLFLKGNSDNEKV